MKNFRDSKSYSPGGGKKFGGGFGSKPAGRGGFGGSRSFGGRSEGRPSMHPAVCDDCGKHCEVPFKPSGDRPVLCSDCFGGNKSKSGPSSRGRDFGGGRDRDFGGGRDFGRNRFEEKRMHEAECDGCGELCEVPFKPTGERPVYCSDCFGQSKRDARASQPFRSTESTPSGENTDSLHAKVDALKLQLEKMTNKLDKVIRLQAPVFSQEEMEELDPPKIEAKPPVKKEKSIKAPEVKKGVTPQKTQGKKGVPKAPAKEGKAKVKAAQKAAPAKGTTKKAPAKKVAAKKVAAKKPSKKK